MGPLEAAGGVQVGSEAWCRATGGRLRFRDQVQLLARAALAQARLWPEALRARLGRAPIVAQLDADTLELPDSAAARAAEQALAELAPTYLLNHSVRTFLWSHLLGQLDGLRFDTEALYVASLLHDVSLLEPEPEGIPCFTIRAAGFARKLLQGQGFDASREQIVADCITHHVNPVVPIEVGVEAHLMNRGVLFDVIGLRTWEIAGADRDAVLHRFPRDRMKLQLYELFEREAKQHPGVRGDFAIRWLQFRRRVFAAPFTE